MHFYEIFSKFSAKICDLGLGKMLDMRSISFCERAIDSQSINVRAAGTTGWRAKGFLN
jgi:hypothetical protein